MDHGADPPLHFHQHRHGQRPQRLGASQDTMSSPTSSLPQHASSPSASAAASPPSYFVRSHQAHDLQPDDVYPRTPTADDAEEARHEPKHQRDQSSALSHHSRASSSTSIQDRGEIAVAIKCPSLDKDSAVIKARLTDTVLSLKRSIEHTWPGAPRADGMRCIRSGRILQDSELLAQLAENLEDGEPLSLHLVIRPDAWSDPQNRPTPSRRSSYLRQQQQQLLEQQLQHLPRSALANEIPLTHHTDQHAPSPHMAESNQPPSRIPTPQFEPYFSDPRHLPNSSSTASATGPFCLQADGASAFTSRPPAMPATTRTSQASADAHAVLEQTLRITAPQNWPLFVEVLGSACDEYILMYEAIYNQAVAAQNLSSGQPDDPSASQPSAPSELLTDVETTLLGWQPVALPGENRSAGPTSQSPGDMQYLYQQVSHRGLPYLLRISSQPIDLERSEALNTLLERIAILRSMIDKIDNIIRLGSLFGSPISNAGASVRATVAPAARVVAPHQRGVIAHATSAVRDWIVGLRTVTLADVTAVLVPMFFVGLKVGLLLSVMLPGADTVKRYFVIGMAAVYVVFESFRIVQRRERHRQRMQPRPVPPRPPAADAGGPVPDNANPGAEAENQGAGAGANVAAPAGANVPSAPSHEEQVERQATEEPLRPLPPPQAPARFRSRSRFTYDWWIDHMAFIGLDSEDAELGLLPPPAPVRGDGAAPSSAQHAPRRGGESWVTRMAASSWVLPVVLFVVTMMPEVEQRRKRAIEERERVIRKWTRLEHERRQRAHDMLAQQAEADKAPARQEGERADVHDTLLQAKRTQYADRIARQRRLTEAVDVDPDDLDAGAALAAAAADEDEDDFEDMNIF